MSLDHDVIARRSAIQHAIATQIPDAAHEAAVTAQPRHDDTRRYMSLNRAVADLTEHLGSGLLDIDSDLVLIAATVQEWLEFRLAEQARCCCPVWDNGPAQELVAIPECPVHGERS